MEPTNDTATFKTRTLRPNSGRPIWFRELMTVAVICRVGDGIVATMPDFGLSAMGQTETEALRALGDVVRDEVARLVKVSADRLDGHELRLKRKLLDGVNIAASGMEPPFN